MNECENGVWIRFVHDQGSVRACFGGWVCRDEQIGAHVMLVLSSCACVSVCLSVCVIIYVDLHVNI